MYKRQAQDMPETGSLMVATVCLLYRVAVTFCVEDWYLSIRCLATVYGVIMSSVFE